MHDTNAADPPVTTLFYNGRDGSGAPLALEVRGACFTRLAPTIAPAAGTRRIDLEGRTVLPGFVDGHIHLDKAFVGDRWHPHQPASGLRERLAIEKRELAHAPPVAERAAALLALAASHGTVAMRSHVDVDATTGLDNLHQVMDVRAAWRDEIDIQLVAFPQAGVVSCPGTAELLEAAARDGVDVIGGIDPSTLDGAADAQLDIVFDIAARHGVGLDIHLHEPGAIGIAQLKRIAQRTAAAGLVGKVAVSHAYCLGEVDHVALDRVALKLLRADIAIMTNAPGDRPFPPIMRLLEAGVRVFAGNDNIRDAWWPFGNADLLQRAMLIAYRAGLYTDTALGQALAMVTTSAAQVIGLRDYGLAVGKHATFVAVRALNAAEAVASVPHDRLIVRRGRLPS